MSRRRPNRHLRERPSAHSILVKQITEVQLASQPDVPQLNTTSAPAGVELSDLRCRFAVGGAADNPHALIRLATAIDGADDNLGALDSVGRQALLAQRDAYHGDLMREDADRRASFMLEEEDPGFDESQDEDEDDYFYEEDEEEDGLAGPEDDQDADDEGEDSAISDLTPTPTSLATLVALTQSTNHLNIPREMLLGLRPPPGEFRLDGQEAGQDNGLEDGYRDQQQDDAASQSTTTQNSDDFTPAWTHPRTRSPINANANANAASPPQLERPCFSIHPPRQERLIASAAWSTNRAPRAFWDGGEEHDGGYMGTEESTDDWVEGVIGSLGVIARHH